MNTVDHISDIKKVYEIIEDCENLRNKVLLAIGFLTGLRISDILRLKIKDLKGEYISVIERKTINTKKKPIPIQKPITKELSEYISKLGDRLKNDNEYVFISQKGINKPITRQQADRIIKYECRRAGIKGRIGTHTMRKTAGSIIYRLTKSETEAQIFLGHANLKDTIRYLGLNKIHMDNITKMLSKAVKEAGRR
jgi:integrase